MTPLLYDAHQRRINYLRLSVTDRCNFRCQYCMPAAGIGKCAHHNILSYEDMLFLARTAIDMGIRKIRVTGGEPLVRRGILPFLHQLGGLPGLEQLVLTTNGFHLVDHAEALRAAGVKHLNISLDSLRANRFRQITRVGELSTVWNGICHADTLGIPIKLNMVVLGGVNDDEILEFAALSLQHNWSIRFIEFMPSHDGNHTLSRISADAIYRRISARYPLQKVSGDSLAGPAQVYRIDGAKGTIGIISAISCSFCESCNRARITSMGKMRSCLFDDHETDLRPYVQHRNTSELKQAIRTCIAGKQKQHNLGDRDQVPALQMSRVGG